MRLVHAPLTLRVCEQRAPAVRVAIFFPLRPSVCRWLCPSAAPPPRLPATGSARSRPPPAGPGPGEPGPAGPKLQPGAHCPAVRLSGGGAQGAGALESAEAPGKETPPPPPPQPPRPSSAARRGTQGRLASLWVAGCRSFCLCLGRVRPGRQAQPGSPVPAAAPRRLLPASLGGLGCGVRPRRRAPAWAPLRRRPAPGLLGLGPRAAETARRLTGLGGAGGGEHGRGSAGHGAPRRRLAQERVNLDLV